MLTSLRSTREFLEACDRLLSRGHTVRFTAEGWSMYPTIQDGETVDVVPVDPTEIQRGDVLLCRLGAGTVAHRVIRVDRTTTEVSAIVLRGDAAFANDPPLRASDILGRVTATMRAGARRPLDTRTARLVGPLVASAWRAKRWLSDVVLSRRRGPASSRREHSDVA